MNKKVILVILFLLLCGCSSEVNINIDGKNISEEINITYMSDEEHTKGEVLSSFRKYTPAFYDVVLLDVDPDEEVEGIDYYQRSLNEYDNGYLFNYKYDFNNSNYVKARSVKSAFRSFNVNNDKREQTLTISSDSGGIILLNQYPELSSVTVNITTSNEVLETNGEKNGSKYTWVFNRNNNNKGIYLKMKVKDENSNANNEVIQITTNEKKEQSFISKYFNEHPVLVIGVSIVLFLLVILIVLKLSRIKYE